MDDPISQRIVIDTDIPLTLVFASKEDDIIQPMSHRSERTIEGTVDEEKELKDDVQSKSGEKVLNFRTK